MPSSEAAILSELSERSHAALIYESEEEWEQAIIPFLAEGLGRKEKCLYITDTRSSGAICRLLRQKGFDIPALMSSEGLMIINQSDVYTKDGHFDPDRIIEFIRAEVAKARAHGFPGLRGTVEATWALRECLGMEKMTEYEAKFNLPVPDTEGYPIKAICQYDRRRFDSGALTQVLMTHPFVIWKGRILRNFHYLPPEAYLAGNRAEAGLERMLQQLSEVSGQLDELQKYKAAAITGAEAARNAKSVFMANMSHELRTPLSGLLGAVQVLEMEKLSEEQRKLLDIIRLSGSTLQHLLQDFIDMGRIESGCMGIAKMPFDIRELVQRVTDQFQTPARKKGLSLTVGFSCDGHELLAGDPFRIEQILMNLLSNAVKYTELGCVSVEVCTVASKAGCSLKISVRDTGIGIAQADLERVFDGLLHLEARPDRRIHGTGLGLAIVKKLLDLMGGQVLIESSVGKGSIFTAVIPLELPMREESRPSILAPRRVPFSGARELRILLAEDDALNRTVIAMLLGNICRCRIDAAETGLAAVEKAEKNRYDMIFMDIKMPVMDGIEAARKIRSLEKGRERTPIIAVTAMATEDDRKRCLDADMDSFLAKPYEAADFRQIIGAIFPTD